MEKEIQSDYISRINKALQFVDKNLDTDLSLEIISEVACYSPYHFHRIFKAITNESLNAYISRRRIEKAASVLMHKKEVNITVLSMQYGFNSNSSFTRTFKKFYGVSPSEFRRQNPGRFSKIGQIESKNGQEILIFEKYICNINNLKNWIEMNAKIEIKEMPALALAYVTSIGHQGIADAYNMLVKWAKPNGLLENAEVKMLTIYHDSFKITAPEKVRMSACIVLSEPVKVNGEIGLTILEKGRFIVGSFEIRQDEFEKSWSSLFIWMGENGYTKADRDPFEIYRNDYRMHPENKFIIDLYIPVL